MDKLIIQEWKLDFSITKPFRYQFEAAVFNQNRLLIVPSPSTALVFAIHTSKHFTTEATKIMNE